METTQKNLCRLFCLSGIIGVIFYVLHDVIGAMNYPGYKWMSQAVSDLTATDSPSYTVATGLSNVFGIMSICCCLFVCVLVTNKHIVTRIGVALYTLMESISGIGYAIFPLSSKGYDGSFQSLMHVYVITSAVVALSIISLILISIGSFKDKRKTLGILAIVALVLMFVGTVGAGAAPKAVFGIFERFSTYSAVVFTAILGVFHSVEK